MNNIYKDLTFTVYSSSFEKSTTGDGKRLIRGYASTSDLDRQREIISRKALEKAKNDLLQNTTVFMDHQHTMLPVGKVLECELDEKGLLITVCLSSAKFVDDIWTLCSEKILNSFSIGGIVIDGHDERGEDGKSYHVIDELAILEVSICGLPANPSAKFSPIYKSFNSAIAEQIKQKEESQKMAKQEKPEVIKSEAPQEPLKVEEPKTEQAVPAETIVEIAKAVEEIVEVTKEIVEVPKQEETILVAKEVETKKEEVAVPLETPKEEVKKEVIVEEPPKVDETPSDKNPKPDLKVEDAEKADWTTEYINTLPNSSFAVIEPAYLEGKTEDKNCRHLPFKDENGEVDLPHYRNALARCNQIKPVTDSISEADLRSQAAAELEKYRDMLQENKSEKSTDEKILDALTLIIEKLSALDKKEVTENKDEVVEQKPEIKEENAIEVKSEETTIEKTVEKVIEKVEEVPTRKSLAIVVPAPYEEEEINTNPKEDERKKNMGWGKLIFGK